MRREMQLPELAESVVEGEILKWLVAEGEAVRQDQPVVEVMTDKVTVELPSPFSGILRAQLVKEGQVVAVHSPIALIDEEGISGAAEAPAGDRGAERPEPEDDPSLFKAVSMEAPLRIPVFSPAGLSAPRGAARPRAVPAARRLAAQQGLALEGIKGSGPLGRIRVQDVLDAAERGRVAEQAPVRIAGALAQIPPPQYRSPKGYEDLEERRPLRGLRRAISQQMQASHLYTVRALTVDEANLSALVALRARLKERAERSGVKLSYLPFIFKAVATALSRFPSLNSSLDEASGEIVLKRYYHLGMAVATEAGLVVPVIRNVDRKSLLALAGEISELAEQARLGKLHPEQMSGSTFSLTNIGSIGALFSFPIINVPDAAILGVHSIVKRPVVAEDDQIVVAHMMYLSLSFDHRLVDGAEAARFCKEVIRLLETPELLLLEGI
jgi:pyruvate dehydrogenase E2 component (dihydrolipoamide acetyltransferase)